MPRNDGLPQKRASGTRREDASLVRFSEPHERETRDPDDEMYPDEDVTTGPVRFNSTVVRRANLPAPRTGGPPGSPVPQRRTGGQTQYTAALPKSPTGPSHPRNTTRQQSPSPINKVMKGKVHWLLPAGIGMIAMLILWELGTLTLSWGLARYDDIRYGNPRTFQINAVVGHGGDSSSKPSHFIAVNLNRQAIVVEFPAGNPAGAQSYVVPYFILGQGGDLTPITLEFRDVTGDKKLDMVIHIHLQNQDQTFVFINDGSKFRAPTNKDNIHLGSS